MASASDIASISIDIQMEASRLESQLVAGDPADFTELQKLVTVFKKVELDKPVDFSGPEVVVPTE